MTVKCNTVFFKVVKIVSNGPSTNLNFLIFGQTLTKLGFSIVNFGTEKNFLLSY